MPRVMEFPKDLEGRLNAIVGGVVNSELKSATLLALDDVPADAEEIKARVREIAGEGYLPRSTAFGSYCHNSFFPIGLVARESVIRDEGGFEGIGYSLTDAGKKYGVPIAEFSLDWAVRNNWSLYEILGSTASPGKSRAPMNTIKILETLANKERNLRCTDLAEAIDLDNAGVQRTVERLQKAGLVKFESVGALAKGKKAVYEWTGDVGVEDVESVKHLPTLTREVAELVAKKGQGEYSALAKEMKKYPVSVSGVLSGLERQGAVKRVKFSRYVKSEVYLLDKGKGFIEDYVAPVKEFLSDVGVLDAGVGGEDIRRGIELYRVVSPNINQKDTSDRVTQVRSYLGGNPRATTREIAEGIGVTATRVRAVMNGLDFEAEKNGHEIRYSLRKEE